MKKYGDPMAAAGLLAESLQKQIDETHLRTEVLREHFQFFVRVSCICVALNSFLKEGKQEEFEKVFKEIEPDFRIAGDGFASALLDCQKFIRERISGENYDDLIGSWIFFNVLKREQTEKEAEIFTNIGSIITAEFSPWFSA